MLLLAATPSSSLSRLYELDPQRLVWTHKMVVGAPPLEVGEQKWGLLGRGPGATSKRCYGMADGQVDSLDESCVESSREA
jgi:hypothetical protein